MKHFCLHSFDLCELKPALGIIVGKLYSHIIAFGHNYFPDIITILVSNLSAFSRGIGSAASSM